MVCMTLLQLHPARVADQRRRGKSADGPSLVAKSRRWGFHGSSLGRIIPGLGSVVSNPYVPSHEKAIYKGNNPI